MPEAVTLDLLIEALYALAIGLFIGLEREHRGMLVPSDPDEPADAAKAVARVNATPDASDDASDDASEDASDDDAYTPSHPRAAATTLPMGVRTFALLAMLGWAIGHAGNVWPWLPPIGLVVIGGLVGLQFAIMREAGSGFTTEIAAVLTHVLGMLVAVDRALAVALALATVLLLATKRHTHALVARMRHVELTGTVQLLILLAIVIPLLPDEALDPWDAVPLRKLGWFVALIAGIGYLGYFSSRFLGHSRGAGVTALLGGLTSSTAVTVAMSKAGRREAMRRTSQLAVFLGNAVMFPRVLFLTAVLSTDVTALLAVPMGAMGAVMVAGAVWVWLSIRASERGRERRDESASEGESTKGEAGKGEDTDDEALFTNPFELLPALKWGVVLAGVMLLEGILEDLLGERGIYIAAGLSGMADVDAITLTVTRQVAHGAFSAQVGMLAVTIAVLAAITIRIGIVLVGGGFRFGARIAVLFAIAVALGMITALLL